MEEFFIIFSAILVAALVIWVVASIAKAEVKSPTKRPSSLSSCSFCGKTHVEVHKLIGGPGVYICNNCVIVCNNLLDKEASKEESQS